MNDTPRTNDQSVRYYDDATGTRIEYVASRFARQLERELIAVTDQRNRLAEALRKLANEDYRGNAPHSVFIARTALATLNQPKP